MTERRSVLITGATRGIGRAIAEELAEGWHILVGGTHADTVNELVASLPSAEPFVVDLTDDAAMADATVRVGQLDALVHSAGGIVVGPIAEMDPQAWRDLFEINVVAVAALTSKLLPQLRASHGQVIAINSGSGFHTRANQSAYSATKHALVAVTNGLREEERGQVRVTSIHPGPVDTDMQVTMQELLGGTYQPEKYLHAADVARTVALALEMRPGANVDYLSVRPAG